MPVLSIIAWHFIRYHHLVYIDHKYISYLSLPIKVFGCNFFLTKFKHLILLIHFWAQHTRWSKKKTTTSTIFLSLFSRLQKHTNPTSAIDAKQYALILSLFVFSEPSIFDNLLTTQQPHHHNNVHRNHPIFLVVAMSQTNQGHTPRRKTLPTPHHHTSLVWWSGT